MMTLSQNTLRCCTYHQPMPSVETKTRPHKSMGPRSVYLCSQQQDVWQPWLCCAVQVAAYDCHTLTQCCKPHRSERMCFITRPQLAMQIHGQHLYYCLARMLKSFIFLILTFKHTHPRPRPHHHYKKKKITMRVNRSILKKNVKNFENFIIFYNTPIQIFEILK